MAMTPIKMAGKKFSQYVKSLHRDPSSVPTLEKDGITYATNLSKANVLNDHFYSVFSKDDTDTLPEMADTPYPTMPNVEIHTTGIIQLLNGIDLFKATGPDGVPPRLLKELSNELAPSLALLFKASLQQSTLPKDWKTALVTPLFKKGNSSDPSNYHPISLTSVCYKVFEHIIYSNIMSHLE